MSAESVAAGLGIETMRLLAYERGSEGVPPDHLERLSRILDVPLTYFFPRQSLVSCGA
jgi:transcriptional regulator with XRE-family HTH domain